YAISGEQTMHLLNHFIVYSTQYDTLAQVQGTRKQTDQYQPIPWPTNLDFSTAVAIKSITETSEGMTYDLHGQAYGGTTTFTEAWTDPISHDVLKRTYTVQNRETYYDDAGRTIGYVRATIEGDKTTTETVGTRMTL